MLIIIKRKGHKEKFDERKVYASVYAVCISMHYTELKCERIADEITKEVKKTIANKKIVKSEQIRKIVDLELRKKGKELAFYYEHHLPNLKKL